MSVETDFYQLLEVERTADDATIKSSYRRLAMRFHYLTGERGSAIVDAIAEVSRILNGLVSSLTTDH